MTDKELVRSIYPDAHCIKYECESGNIKFWVVTDLLYKDKIYNYYNILPSHHKLQILSTGKSEDIAWTVCRIKMQNKFLEKLNE